MDFNNKRERSVWNQGQTQGEFPFFPQTCSKCTVSFGVRTDDSDVSTLKCKPGDDFEFYYDAFQL